MPDKILTSHNLQNCIISYFVEVIKSVHVRTHVCRSLELVGNPIGLVSTLGIGVRDFFYEPAHALINRYAGRVLLFVVMFCNLLCCCVFCCAILTLHVMLSQNFKSI